MGGKVEFVVSSRVVNPAYGSPTDLFAADADGKITCWAELGMGDDYEDAFRAVGYVVVIPKDETYKGKLCEKCGSEMDATPATPPYMDCNTWTCTNPNCQHVEPELGSWTDYEKG
jgi:hypothetical protein